MEVFFGIDLHRVTWLVTVRTPLALVAQNISLGE